jgi:hypothetical protein
VSRARLILSPREAPLSKLATVTVAEEEAE